MRERVGNSKMAREAEAAQGQRENKERLFLDRGDYSLLARGSVICI